MARPEQELDALQDVGKTPEARDVFAGATLRAFSHYVEERIAIAQQIEQLEKEKKVLSDRITNMLVGEGQSKLIYDGRAVQIIEGSRSSIDKMKLIEHGVSPIIIRDSTVTTTYSYLNIGKPKNQGRGQ